MLFIKLIIGLCFIVGVVFREVELTPIVTIPPETVENVITTTEKVAISKPSINNVSSISDGVHNPTENIEKNYIPKKLGEIETVSSPEQRQPLNKLMINDTDSNNKTTTVVSQPITKSADGFNNKTETQGATVPELLIKTGSNTTTSSPPTTTELNQLMVTSQSISLKKEGPERIKLSEKTVPPVVLLIKNETAIHNPAIVSPTNGSNETEGNYKDIAPPEYHTYIEEILRIDETEDNDTSTQSAPIRIKSKGYQSSNKNALKEHKPYGPLPKFAEKDMDKLRLNHWRVNQILKGDSHYNNDPKLQGQLGTGKANLQGKSTPSSSPVPFPGQKRASTSTASIMKSSPAAVVDQDEFHSSILASHADAANENDETSSSPSKLRQFFNWISSPLKRKSSKEDERLKQTKAQQPILPFALGYRGDFLFW